MWTTDRVLQLAPDAFSAKAGQGLADARQWVTLGRSDRALWGEYKGSATDLYQTQIEINEPAFRCTCPSRKFPCKHAIALFLLFADQPGALKEAEPPAWVADWLKSRDAKAQRQTVQEEPPPKAAAPDPARQAKRAADQAKRAAQREAKVAAGIEELDRWLRDLVRQGFAALQAQSLHTWNTMAARMVDAQAPGLARQLLAISGLAATGEGWQERLMARLGRLYLLIEAYQRLSTLPEPIQADVRTCIGWTYDRKALMTQAGVCDTWLVVGQRAYEDYDFTKRRRVRRTWLHGQTSGQAALLIEFDYGKQPFDPSLTAGTQFAAELVYYPTNYPLRAEVKARMAPPAPVQFLPGYETLEALLQAYANSLARNPWLELFPASLASVIPICKQEQWYLRDLEDRLLPLSPSFNQSWQLLALSGGYPMMVFGEWDGAGLFPLSVWAEERYVPL